jgi:phosphatidylglycerophosphatase A
MASKAPPIAVSLLKNPAHLLSLGLGSGLAPVAPGTAGTLVAIPLYLLLAPLPAWWYLAVTAVLFGLGIWLCGYTARALNCHDHPGIVWDEVVGYLLTMFLAPAGIIWIIIGFCLFRLFDIWKPWPIRWLDGHIGGGLGIMIDDLLAGVYAALCLQAVVYLMA